MFPKSQQDRVLHRQYASLASNKRAESRSGPANFLCKRRLAHTHRFEKLLKKHLSQVERVLWLSLHGPYFSHHFQSRFNIEGA